MIKISDDEIKFINFFQNRTHATVKDCIIDDSGVIVIVKGGQMGFAIGKKGEMINKLKKEVGREIHAYEHADSPEEFIRNLLFPVRVERVEIAENKARVYVGEEDKKRAIGHGGKKINLVRELAERHFGIKEVKVV
ncbi:NusA-like transcription termination signal-binding factor [Candidatus Micrarchaeota archaeon]|nr:NusA-like transcription termination signal-binding factor [Candidatus Micrarchaeota archaeon]